MKAPLLFIALFLFVFPLFGQDVEGCADHPMISRMPGYYITGCTKSFNQAEVAIGETDGQYQRKPIEGNVTALDYYYQEQIEGKQPSWLQVTKNYENAIKKIGGKKIFSDRYVGTYRITKGGSDTWVAIELQTSDADAASLYSYTVKVIEIEAMKQEITANDILDELNKSGFIALYINFETGKADIKPESQGVVDQIIEMLKANSTVNISIEGHTDNVGTPAANKTLSENRAKAVMNAISGKGIERKRLTASGWGQEKPVADNRTEEGRAKNRRVEIVKK